MQQAAPMVEPRGLIAPRGLFFFEKWYFDAQTGGGDFVLAYLAPIVLFGSASAELVVCLFPREGAPERRSFHLAGRGVGIARDRTRAVFEGGELALAPGGSHLRLRQSDAELELAYSDAAAPWTPAPEQGGVMLRSGGRVLRWVVPVPRARIEGSVRVGGLEVCFTGGLGYSDFVQTDVPPWRLPLRELLWGRALGPDRLAIWDRAVFCRGGAREVFARGLLEGPDGERRVTEHVGAELGGWVDHAPTRDRWPARLDLRFGGPTDDAEAVVLGDTRLLLGEFVADVQRFRSGLERGLYRRFTRNPVEYKLLSQAQLPGAPQPVVAAHEWIRWGRR